VSVNATGVLVAAGTVADPASREASVKFWSVPTVAFIGTGTASSSVHTYVRACVCMHVCVCVGGWTGVLARDVRTQQRMARFSEVHSDDVTKVPRRVRHTDTHTHTHRRVFHTHAFSLSLSPSFCRPGRTDRWRVGDGWARCAFMPRSRSCWHRAPRTVLSTSTRWPSRSMKMRPSSLYSMWGRRRSALAFAAPLASDSIALPTSTPSLCGTPCRSAQSPLTHKHLHTHAHTRTTYMQLEKV
jgi:hypothetical protein